MQINHWVRMLFASPQYFSIVCEYVTSFFCVSRLTLFPFLDSSDTFSSPVDSLSFLFNLFRRLIMMNTMPLRVPPTLEYVVTNWKISWGTTSDKSCQVPYTAMAHHWTKKATTNSDMFLAALCDARTVLASFPSTYLRRRASERSRTHVRAYRTTFEMKINNKGTVVKKMLAISPLTPSNMQLKKQLGKIRIFVFFPS